MTIPQNIENGRYWDRGLQAVFGCSKVDPSCSDCWALGLAKRFPKMRPTDGILCGKEWGDTIHYSLDCLEKHDPKRPKTFAVWNDLLHPRVPDDFIQRFIHRTAKRFYHSTILVLTKRPSRLKSFIWPENFWVGTSIPCNKYLYRLDELLDARATVKYISYEPAIEQLMPISDAVLDHIDWIIAGTYSGGNPRIKGTLHWIERVARICETRALPLFVKQWYIDGKVVKAPKILGKQWLQFPKQISAQGRQKKHD